MRLSTDDRALELNPKITFSQLPASDKGVFLSKGSSSSWHLPSQLHTSEVPLPLPAAMSLKRSKSVLGEGNIFSVSSACVHFLLSRSCPFLLLEISWPHMQRIIFCNGNCDDPTFFLRGHWVPGGGLNVHTPPAVAFFFHKLSSVFQSQHQPISIYWHATGSVALVTFCFWSPFTLSPCLLSPGSEPTAENRCLHFSRDFKIIH